MITTFFLKGLGIGFAIAAPVGPIGLLCIRRSLHGGRWLGLATGLGAATADTLYGCVASFGLTTVSAFLLGHQHWLGLVGGAFMCWMGVHTFRARLPDNSNGDSPAPAALPAYVSTLMLTLTNPMTILAFVALFAGMGLGAQPDLASALLLVAGVFLGSALWWLFLSNATALLRGRLTANWHRTVNRVSGSVIVLFGLYALYSAL